MGLVTIVRLKTGNRRSYLTSSDKAKMYRVHMVITFKHVIIVIKVKIVTI